MVCILDSCSILNLLNALKDDRIFKKISAVFDQVYVSQYVYSNEIFNKKLKYKDLHDNINNFYHSAGLGEIIYTEDLNDVEIFVNNFCKKKSISLKDDGEYYSSLTALHISRFHLPDSDFNTKVQRVLFVTDDAPAKDEYEILFESNQIGGIITSVDLVIILYIKDVIKSIKEVKNYISDCIMLYKKELTNIDNALKKLPFNTSKESQLVTNLIGLLSDNNYEQINLTLKKPLYKDFYKNNPQVKTMVSGLKNLTFKTKIPELLKRKEEIHKDLIWKI